MHSPSSDIRFSEAQKLLNFGFSNFTNVSLGKKGDIVQTLSIQKGVPQTVNAVLAEDASFFVKKSKSNDITQAVNLKSNIAAPIAKNEKIGSITYSSNGNVIKTIDIIAENDVSKLTLINMSQNIMNRWFSLLR